MLTCDSDTWMQCSDQKNVSSPVRHPQLRTQSQFPDIFETFSGPTMDLFWTHFVNPFWTLSEHFLDPFWAHVGHFF